MVDIEVDAVGDVKVDAVKYVFYVYLGYDFKPLYKVCIIIYLEQFFMQYFSTTTYWLAIVATESIHCVYITIYEFSFSGKH